LPDENIQLLLDIGVPRMFVPQRWGGLEWQLRDVLDMVITLGHGCMSTAWVAAVQAEHPWVLAHFDEAAQADVWRDGPDVFICLSHNASAEAKRLPGGYMLGGKWRFVSGCDHAAWFLFAGAVDEPRGRRMFLIPRSDVAIDQQSWNVSGLRGTGSKTVSIRGAFVPEHHALNLDRPYISHSPNVPPLYRQPLPATLGQCLSAVALGGADAAYELFREAITSRMMHLQGQFQAADPAAQLDLAEAAARIDSARLLLHHMCAIGRETGERCLELSALEIARMRIDKNFAVRLCAEAIDRLFAASGGGALQDSNPLQRIWRNVHAVQAHAGITWANHARNFGSQAVGLPPTTRQMF